MFSKMFERFLPFLEADDGTNIAGVEDGDLADLQDDEDLDDDSGEKDSDLADQKDMSFKEDPRNKEFADKRRKEELDTIRIQNQQLAKDNAIAKKYGAEYGVFSEQDIAAKYGQSHGITTLEQFETALMNQQYKQAGIDPNLINQIVSSHPTLKKAEMLIQQMNDQQANSTIVSEFEELKKQFPESGLKTLADLGKLPTYKAIEEKFARGYSLADAYESVNRSEIRAKQQAAAKQKTLNDINSKSHLNTEGDGEGETNDVHIPAETMQMYLDQGRTKKEAIAFHKKLYG